jgi:NTE family protein
VIPERRDTALVRVAGSRLAVSRVQWLKRLGQRRHDRVAFVFSGGGPLGALQVGAVRALVERNILPDLVVGTSVGAINASHMAFEPSALGVQRLEDAWALLIEKDLFPGSGFMATWSRMLRRGDRIFDNSSLRELIETGLGSGASFEDAQLPLGVVTTELLTGEERVFTSGPILEPLLASTAMPGALPPVTIDGRRFIDGGVVNNVPITPALKMGASTIYVLNATAHTQHPRPLNRPMDYLMHAFSLARAQRLIVERSKFADTERAEIVMLPAVPLDFFVPFTSFKHTKMLIKRSYETTSHFLDSAPQKRESARERTFLLEATTQAE